MRIGVVGDTHLTGDWRLPQRLKEAFDGVERIIHVGDLVAMEVLSGLEALAPVTAVHGNMDASAVTGRLPLKTTVEATGRRIGIIHGHGVPERVWLGGGRVDFDAFHEYLLGQFDAVDCIVYGHTHLPVVEERARVLLFNPGSATGKWPADGPTVGVLTVADDGISAEIVEI